jgi:carbohydrate-binding DOMON domain-containing protein
LFILLIDTCYLVEINVRENRRSKQEWAIQKAGNVGHTRHRTKTNRAKKTPKNTTQKTKMTSNTDPPRNGGDPVLTKGHY